MPAQVAVSVLQLLVAPAAEAAPLATRQQVLVAETPVPQVPTLSKALTQKLPTGRAAATL